MHPALLRLVHQVNLALRHQVLRTHGVNGQSVAPLPSLLIRLLALVRTGGVHGRRPHLSPVILQAVLTKIRGLPGSQAHRSLSTQVALLYTAGQLGKDRLPSQRHPPNLLTLRLQASLGAHGPRVYT